jgi:hypothetical protein
MAGKIEGLGEGVLCYRYVRIGGRYSLGNLNHLVLSCKLLNIKEDNPNNIRKKILETGEEIDMGMMVRRGAAAVIVGGESVTFNFPSFESKYDLIKQRTVDLLKRDYPDEEFIVGSL